MVSERSDQADMCDLCRFRHQESHIQRVSFKVGQTLQGDRGVIPPIRSNYGIKCLSILVDPLNLGTFVVVKAAGLGRAGGVHVAGVSGTAGTGGASFSAYTSFFNRATVSIRSAGQPAAS